MIEWSVNQQLIRTFNLKSEIKDVQVFTWHANYCLFRHVTVCAIHRLDEF